MSTPRRMSLERARSNACGGAREALPLKEEAWRSSEQTYFGRAYCLPPCPRPAPPLWTPAPPLARDEAPRRGGGGRGPGRGGSGVRRSVHRLVNLCVREAFAAQSAEHSARAGARDAPRGSTRISHAAVRHGAPRSAACAGGGAREHGTAPARTARRGTEKWIPAQSLPIRPIRRRPGHPVPSTGSHPPAVGASARAYLLRRPVGARPRQLRRAGRPHPPTRATAPGRTAVRPLAVALVAQVDPLTPPAPPQGGTRRAQAVPRPRRAEGRMHFLSDKPG